VRNGLPRSIDFVGGSVFELRFAEDTQATEEQLRQVYEATGLVGPSIVAVEDPDSGQTSFQIRSAQVTQAQKDGLSTAIREEIGEFDELRFDSIGPSLGALVARNAAIAVVMAALGILVYLTIMFRGVDHPVRYGIAAILAMLHDVVVVLGIASIMGYLYGWEVDSLFLTALLTVIGFSVHDSIVVFDRIRENVGRMRGHAYERIVNHSVIQTLDRSINTQLTAVFTLLAIWLYSQGQIKQFIFYLLVGIVSGTYSSIFNAAPILVVWENREWRNWFGRGARSAAA
jgi:preprotein translocase subunit SecF